jgi:hypothetical protein
MLCLVTVKEAELRTIERLPEDVARDDMQERISFVAVVRQGLQESEEDPNERNQPETTGFAS